VKAVVLSVDAEKKRVALGLKQLNEDPWKHAIPRRFSVGDCLSGAVTKSTNFGVFVELEDGLEGLLHISELGPKKVHSPEEVVRVGDKVQVRILKVDPEERKIGLTLIQVEERAPLPPPGEKAAEAAASGDGATAKAEEPEEPEEPGPAAEEGAPKA
jgi:small subunit ribosomal protein S1